MTYIPQKSLDKALGSVRISHTGAGAADLFVDTGASSPITFTLGSWTEIYSSSSSIVKAIEIFDATGEVAIFGIGPASSEVAQFRVIPGGNGLNYFKIQGSTRIVMRYETALPAVNSETVINFYK
jgi:hypothetical protein